MKFIILTLFPEMFTSFFEASILKRAIGLKKIEVKLVNIRDYTKDKYNRVDSAPIGGGAGLIMKAQPILDAIKNNSTPSTYKIALSPRGNTFNQAKSAKYASNLNEILIFCGHYEGFDERIYKYFDEIISIGDYILTGGEPAAMAIVDSVSRLIPGVISEESIKEESFDNGLLEYPQYTEPYNFEGEKVPDILYSGNHTAISKRRKKKALELTRANRIDLFDKYPLSKNDIKLLNELDNEETPKWEKDALEKGKKFIKNED
ncbi:MAG: tRNA (guanosine(37)-N1)-methyltransferase TrmD [Bacilli bacterium]|nr:tRNA (guanosine(37)-N1)-methyltransferase TrmD [Bacilli bacterium]